MYTVRHSLQAQQTAQWWEAQLQGEITLKLQQSVILGGFTVLLLILLYFLDHCLSALPALLIPAWMRCEGEAERERERERERTLVDQGVTAGDSREVAVLWIACLVPCFPSLPLGYHMKLKVSYLLNRYCWIKPNFLEVRPAPKKSTFAAVL